jgi:hypothetical protein
VIEPLRPLFDDIISSELGTSQLGDGTDAYDGRMKAAPPTGEARYQALVDYADLHAP